MPMSEIEESIQELTNAAPASNSAAPAPAPNQSNLFEDNQGDFQAEQNEDTTRARDATGKFTPKSPAQEQATLGGKPGEQAQVIDPAPKPDAPAQSSRAPISWKPEEREGWEKMDPRHQQAIIRRELEASRALSMSDRAREFTSQIQQTLQPYMPMIAAEGTDPVRAIGEFFKIAATLRTAAPQTKAQLVADMIVQHGIDPELLDQAYMARRGGRQSPPDQMTLLMQQFDQRLAPIQEKLNIFERREQMAAQQIEQQASQTIEQFMSDPANEFAGDVSQDMADLLELATNRGLTLTIQDAYRRATLAHPTISKIMERRMLTGGAAQQNAAALRARQASASVTDSGAPSQTVEDGADGDLRSALTASIRDLSQRR